MILVDRGKEDVIVLLLVLFVFFTSYHAGKWYMQYCVQGGVSI